MLFPHSNLLLILPSHESFTWSFTRKEPTKRVIVTGPTVLQGLWKP